MVIGAAYFGNRILRHAASDMADLAERGFTGVLHTFSENDLAHYREQMGRLVAASHDVGLQVQLSPWGLGGVFGGEAESGWIAADPMRGQVLADGTRVGAACLSDPRFRAFVRGWADAAIAAGADRIFWDEPSWGQPAHGDDPASQPVCVCDACRERFARRDGRPMPAELTEEVAAFHEAVLVEFVQEMVAYVAGRGVANTVCLLPLAEGPLGLQDWGPIAAAPGVDTLATTPYWRVFGQPVEGFVGAAAERLLATARAHGVGAELWLQGFGLGPDEVSELRTAARVARAAGIEDLWVWGYDAGGHMSSLGTRHPETVWEAICDVLTGRG